MTKTEAMPAIAAINELFAKRPVTEPCIRAVG
jgi:hypothetical protein